MSVRISLAAGVVGFAALTAVAPVSPPATRPAPSTSVLATDFTQQDLVMAANGCGTERWAVKTGSDAERNLVSTTQHQTTIAALRGLRQPSSYPSNGRIRPTELTEYVIAGTLTQYKLEADNDIHAVIKDSAGRSVIVEFPSTSCVVAARFKTEIGNARHLFTTRYTPSTPWHYTHRAIRVRGIGFFDYLHGQTGVAPNGIELHPVLGVGFP